MPLEIFVSPKFYLNYNEGNWFDDTPIYNHFQLHLYCKEDGSFSKFTQFS